MLKSPSLTETLYQSDSRIEAVEGLKHNIIKLITVGLEVEVAHTSNNTAPIIDSRETDHFQEVDGIDDDNNYATLIADL